MDNIIPKGLMEKQALFSFSISSEVIIIHPQHLAARIIVGFGGR